jgi:hypothetical protein
MRSMLVLGTLLAAVVAVPAIGQAVSTAPASNSTSYVDSTGEDVAAPDITGVTVSNDDAGVITFRIAVSNRPVLAQDMLFLVYIDTAQGAGDPDAFGADYAIQLEPAGLALFKWNGSTYTFASSSASFTYATSGPTIRLGASDLMGAKKINFVVLAVSGITVDVNGEPDYGNVHTDAAPDRGHGTYSYAVLTTFSLEAAGFSLSPATARAGRAFAVGLAVRQRDTGALVQAGTVTCVARVDGRRVPVRTSRLRNGVGVCVWSIPPSARGRTIRGTISVGLRGARLKRAFSAPIS